MSRRVAVWRGATMEMMMPLTKKNFDLTVLAFDAGANVRHNFSDHRFRGFLGPSDKEAHGFVPMLREDAVFDATEDEDAWICPDDPNLVCVALRSDVRKVPGDVLKRKVKEKIKAWCEERGVERCPASVKKEIKELTEDELLPRVLPKTKLTQICISFAKLQIYVDTTNQNRLDLVRKHLRRAGIATSILPPWEHRDTDPMEGSSFSPQSFYAWLWMSSEKNASSGLELVGDRHIDLWVGDRVGLRTALETKVSTVVTGENPGEAITSRSGLQGGMVVEQLRLCLRHDDLEYSALLDGGFVLYKQLKLPSTEATDDWGNIIERMFLTERFDTLIRGLVTTFETKPKDEIVAELNDWMEIEPAA